MNEKLLVICLVIVVMIIIRIIMKGLSSIFWGKRFLSKVMVALHSRADHVQRLDPRVQAGPKMAYSLSECSNNPSLPFFRSFVWRSIPFPLHQSVLRKLLSKSVSLQHDQGSYLSQTFFPALGSLQPFPKKSEVILKVMYREYSIRVVCSEQLANSNL